MADCRTCRRTTDTYLCNLCIVDLKQTLAELPWLLTQLQITITRQDKLNLGIVGKSGNASPSPINVGAMELSRQLRSDLAAIITTLTEARHLTPPPADCHVMVGWLALHTPEIAGDDNAGTIMRDLNNARDALLRAINRNLRMYCGPCITVTAHNRQGEAIECGHDIYAQRDSDDPVQCPRCKTWTTPREQLLATISRRDLLPEANLLETLDTLGEPVSRNRLYGWIKAGRLRPRGWIHHGRIVPRQVRRGDPRVFSLSQARQLRLSDEAA